MQAAVLPDQRQAINADNFTVGEAELEPLQHHRVRRVAIGRYQHGTIDNEEVRIGRRHTLAGIVELCARPGQRHQPVRPAIGGTECLQLRRHRFQFRIMFVSRIVASNVGDGVRIAQAREGVDVAVGVVAGEGAVL